MRALASVKRGRERVRERMAAYLERLQPKEAQEGQIVGLDVERKVHRGVNERPTVLPIGSHQQRHWQKIPSLVRQVWVKWHLGQSKVGIKGSK